MPETEESRLSRALSEGRRSAHRALTQLLAPAAVTAAPVDRVKMPHAGNLFAVRLRIEDRPGVQLLFLTREVGGARLASALLKRDVDAHDTAAQEAIGELANIAASSFLNGLAHVADVRLLPTVPTVETIDALPVFAMIEAWGSRAYEIPFDVAFPDASVRVVFIAVDEARAP